MYDGLGSTANLTDGSGNSTASYGYDVFGAVRSHTGASTEWSFTGEQNDPTGLEYLRARYYDQATGRFVSRDPIPFVNRYAYVGNNPVRYVDPSGLSGIPGQGGTSTSCSLTFDPFCEGFGGGGGGGGAIPIGPVIVVGVGAGVAGATWVGGQAIGGAEGVWGGVTSLFSKKKMSRSDYIEKWRENVSGAMSIADKIVRNPCSRDRSHWEDNLRGALNKANNYGRRVGIPETTVDYLPMCPDDLRELWITPFRPKE